MMTSALVVLLWKIGAQAAAGDSRAAEEARLVKELEALVEKKERTQEEEIQVVAKARELGRVGTRNSVDFLVRRVDFRSGLRMEDGARALVRHHFPFVGALTDIGAPALNPVLELLGNTDEAVKTALARAILYGVGVEIFGTVENGARANRFAQGTIQAAIGDATQPRGKRLAASAAYFAGRAEAGVQSEPK